MLILREKELTEKEYEALALEVLKACKEEGITCVLHSFVRVAEKLGVKKIHLPLARLREEQQNLSFFDTIGVSVHSSQEAKEAYRLGATYLTAGIRQMSGHVSRGSAGEYQADERAGVARPAVEYQADERARVARLSWRE